MTSIAPPYRKWLQHLRTIDTVHVIHVDLRRQTERELSLLRWLDASELARWHGYLHLQARYAFTLCRAALRIVLCQQLACHNEQLSFAQDQQGKPFAILKGRTAALSFNLSHSGRHGLLAFAPEGQLGIDVEMYTTRRYLERLTVSGALFTAPERAALAQVQGQDKLRLFTQLWTVKEALAKAKGTGLRVGLASYAVPEALLTCGRELRATGARIANKRVYCIGNADYAAALVDMPRR